MWSSHCPARSRRWRICCSSLALCPSSSASKVLRSGAANSAAAVGVAARISATKSAIEKSLSCPTPLMMGTGLAAMQRASASSLKAAKSSALPPPRTNKITSGRCAGGRVQSACRAAINSAGADAPCTLAGANSTGRWGARRARVCATSCCAAPAAEVTRPKRRGKAGRGRLRVASNKPSACSLAFRRKKASYKAPALGRVMCSTTSCKSPRGWYSDRRARSCTCWPLAG